MSASTERYGTCQRCGSENEKLQAMVVGANGTMLLCVQRCLPLTKEEMTKEPGPA